MKKRIFSLMMIGVFMLMLSNESMARKRPDSKKWHPNKEYQKRHDKCVAEQNRIQGRYKR